MQVTFYFDPACPFSWITSRWLLTVQEFRDVEIDWQPFSLAIKNNHLTPSEKDSIYAKKHQASHRVLRVIEAAATSHDASRIKLYTYIGAKFHNEGLDYDDQQITAMLEEFNLPATLLEAADDTSYDDSLSQKIAEAVLVAGEDVGVPIIVFTNEHGEKQGYFGPVLQALPNDVEAIDLWDGLSKLATSSSFYELKRQRPKGEPDTDSTKAGALDMSC